MFGACATDILDRASHCGFGGIQRLDAVCVVKDDNFFMQRNFKTGGRGCEIHRQLLSTRLDKSPLAPWRSWAWIVIDWKTRAGLPAPEILGRGHWPDVSQI